MATHRARQTGSAFTAWLIGDKPLVFCQEVSHRAPQPIAQPVPVHPINYLRPIEIIVPRAITHGEIVMTVMETFDMSIWQHFEGLNVPSGIEDLADFFNWMMTSSQTTNPDDGSSKITLKRIIRDPKPGAGWRTMTFQNARVVDVRNDETTRVDTTLNPLSITVWYTYANEDLGAKEAENVINDHVGQPIWGS